MNTVEGMELLYIFDQGEIVERITHDEVDDVMVVETNRAIYHIESVERHTLKLIHQKNNEIVGKLNG